LKKLYIILKKKIPEVQGQLGVSSLSISCPVWQSGHRWWPHWLGLSESVNPTRCCRLTGFKL